MKRKTIFTKLGESQILWIIVSVVLSFMIWVLVSVNETEDYQQTFDNVPVVFSGEDALREAQGLVVTEQTRSTVSVTVMGPRREVAKIKKTDIQAVIDLSTITRPGTNTNYYYSVEFNPDVDKSNITVASRTPRTLSFTVDRYSFKYVEVVGMFNGSVAEGFKADVSDMRFEPSTIRVSGPEAEIAKVDKALVVIERNAIDSTINVDMGYSLVDSGGDQLQLNSVTTDVDAVNVTLPVTVVKTVPLSLDVLHGAGTTDGNVRMEFEPKEIQISGDADVVKLINKISLGSLDLTEFNQLHENTYPIVLPNDIVNESGISEAKVSVRLVGLAVNRLSVTDIQPINVPEGFVAEVSTQSIDVTIRAPEGQIDEIKAKDLYAVLDLRDYTNNEGMFTAQASIRIDGYPDAGVINPLGYSALVVIKPDPNAKT
ncbi:MAG: hypothetical protein IKK00_03785 [Oscillospiraceae bacterium]|nr:hypothetical protein [Oscillospiraceae bacterium]MBR6562077.1 hypothetical protein [Oscillospiraceae bacterium]